MAKKLRCTRKKKEIDAQKLKLESNISFLLQAKVFSTSKAATEL